MKTCNKCKEEKELTEFHKRSEMKDGLATICKACIKLKSQKWYQKNREKVLAKQKKYTAENREKIQKYKSQYRAENKEKIAEFHRGDYIKNKEKILARCRKYRKENKEKVIASGKRYRNENREKRKKYQRKYRKKRRKTDPNYALRCVLRSRLSGALNGERKSASTMALLGCTVEELKAYIEQKFTEEMTWENRGPVWHIDHITPCASFDLSDPEQQRQCFHHSNLQPLNAVENMQKGDKILYERKWNGEGWEDRIE
jgi:hypothetical protein